MSDWIDWNGGECPVPVGTKVDVKHRDGEVFFNQSAGIDSHHPIDGHAYDWMFNTKPYGGDIVAYRIHKEN